MYRYVRSSSAQNDERQDIIDYVNNSNRRDGDQGYLLMEYIEEYGDIEALLTLDTGKNKLEFIDIECTESAVYWDYKDVKTGKEYEFDAKTLLAYFYNYLYDSSTVKEAAIKLAKQYVARCID